MIAAAAMRSRTEARITQLPKIADARGNLTFIESLRNVPFCVRRAYWIYDVPGGDERSGGHAYRTSQEFIVALSGSFDVSVSDDDGERTFPLNRSYFGLFVPNTLWRRVHNFSTNAVGLVLSSSAYEPAEYLRDRAQWLQWRRETPSP